MSDSEEDRAALGRQEKVFRGVVAVVADAVSLVGGPSAILQAAAERAVAKRRAAARDVLIEELKAGGVELEPAILEQVDESAAIMVRFQRAADEGARLRNLRLLARAFRRQLAREAADADRFQQTAASLDSLSDEELDLLGRWLAFGADKELNDLRQDIGMEWESPEREHLYAVASGLLRNGLVVPGSAFGGMAYSLSPAGVGLLQDLEAADFKEA